MRKLTAVALLAAALAASGCARHRSSGDAFTVARSAPLVIPPDFALAPPVAGTQGSSANEAQQQAIDTLFGGPAARSPGEMSMLDAAGRADAQIGIRSQVWDPNTRLVDKGATTLTILSAPAGDTSAASAQAGR